LSTWVEFDIPRALDGRRPDVNLKRLNVAMHAFEALLVLFKATHSDLVGRDLRRLGSHISSDSLTHKKDFCTSTWVPE